ncbi:MAG: hypothetical protein LLF87_09480, partial [Eubacteriales bacterium]|nr:hypothetical protein [Eubacteriales bacterium]
CTLNIETKIFDEARAARLLETVTGDLETVAAKILVKQDAPEIYVVQKALHGAERIGYCVYCTAEDVESGAYREALVCEALNLDASVEWWKLKGLVAYAFGETADEAALHAYYEQTEDMDLLSLFPAYFVKEFASKEELNLAHETALSLTAYILEKYGAEAFLKKESGKDYRQEWLTDLGVQRAYADPYQESFEGYSYSASSQYPFIVTTDRQDVFYMLPLPDDVDTPKAIRDFLYLGKKGMAAVLAGIKEDAPDYYQTLADNYSHPIRYYFKTGRGVSLSYYQDHKVVLTVGNIETYLHETIHIMIPLLMLTGVDIWRYEGIADYLPYAYAELYREGDLVYDNCFSHLFGGNENYDAFDTEFFAKVREIYLQHANRPAAPAALDLKLYWECRYEAALLDPQFKPALPCIPRTDFAFSKANILTDYLIEKYSLSEFLRYCLAGDKIAFEDMFGMTFEQALAESMEEFLKTPG